MGNQSGSTRPSSTNPFHERSCLGVVAMEGPVGSMTYGIFNAEANAPLKTRDMKIYASIEELVSDIKSTSDGRQPVLCGDIPAAVDDAPGKVRTLNASELKAIQRLYPPPSPLAPKSP